MANIKYLVMDVDGTLTDGKIYMGDNGEIFKVFDVKDGYAISHILPERKIIPIVITARKSNIVLNRCKELGIEHCYQGCNNKKDFFCKLMKKFDVSPINGKYYEVAYVGDDLVDLPCMEICGIAACPANAAKEVREVSDFISKKNGGNGVIREFIEWLDRSF